jgi:hypothetical protein
MSPKCELMLRLHWRTVVCFLSFLAVGRAVEFSVPPIHQEVLSKEDGFLATSRLFRSTGDMAEFVLVSAEVDLNKWNLAVQVPNSTPSGSYNDISGLPLAEYARSGNAKLVMSGGYLMSYSPASPLGLVLKGGRSVSREHNSWLTSAILCIYNDRSVAIVYASDGPRPNSAPDCIQAGPMLVNRGHAAFEPERVGASAKKLWESLQEQAFVCVDDNGKILLGVSQPARPACCRKSLFGIVTPAAYLAKTRCA